MLMNEEEQIEIIVKDEPFFKNENGELFYNLGKERDDGVRICRKVLEAITDK